MADKVEQYLKARAEGNLAEQARVQGTMKGPDLTRLARALRELPGAGPGAPDGPNTPKPPKEGTMATATQAKPAKPGRAAKPVVSKLEAAVAKAVAPRPVAARPEPKVGNVIKPQYRGSFATLDGLKTASGARVIATTNDVVTQVLAGTTTEDLQAIAARCGVDFTWGHLNPGMQRMNLGNRLRSVLRRGELSEETLTGRTQVAKPARKAAAKASK